MVGEQFLFYIALAVVCGLVIYSYWRRFVTTVESNAELEGTQTKIRNIARRVNLSLEGHKTTPIREAPTGQVVKIAGEIEGAGKTLQAPLSQRECVFYEVVVEQYDGSARLGEWLPLFRDAKATDFFIVDDTDRALIKQEKLRTALRATAEMDHQQTSGAFSDATPELDAYLSRHGQSSTALGMNRKLRYREGIFEIGESVVAMGTATREHATDSANAGNGYRGAAQRFVLGPLPGGSILISDDSALTE